MPKRIDLNGQQFGRLTVISFAGINKNRKAMWICQCECGKTKTVLGESLRQEKTRSCGCLSAEKASKTLHDYNIRHGRSGTRLYTIWNNMIQRVLNENNTAFKNYGGRGIGICEEWKKFQNFEEWALKNGYQYNLTIDRLDNNEDYCPDNCRWVDWDVQNNNKRQSRKLEYKGEIKTIAQWAKIKNVRYETLRDRIDKLGWTIEKAIETPIRNKNCP